MWQTVSIRMSFLRNVVGVIVLLAGAILATTIFFARKAVVELSRSVTSVAIDLTEIRLREFFQPVTDELLVTREWGRTGLLQHDDEPGMRRLLQPVLDQHRQLAAIIFADEIGREFMLLRTQMGYSSRQIDQSKWGNKARILEWSREDSEPLESFRELEDYMPRERPWFQGAVDRRSQMVEESAALDSRDLIHWTSPYEFYTLKRPGITASVTYEDRAGVMGVVAFDIELSSISEFTESVQVMEHGGVIVLTQDTRILGLPRVDHFETPTARQAALLRQPQEVGLPLADDAHAAFRANIHGADNTPVQFQSGGETWWGRAKLFPLGPDEALLMGVVLPERDIITNLPILRLWILGITLFVLIAAILRAIVLSRRFSRPIEQLVEQSQQISRGNLESGAPVESRVQEVQALAVAQEHMRTAIRSLLKLERDMQLAKQIQRQTFPSVMPTIAGYEVAAWVEPADETGGDTYDVIGFEANSRAPGSDDVVNLTTDNPRFTVMLLADATGHGIGPALAVTQFRSMARMAIRTGGDLRTVARHINDQLCADLPSGRFITAWVGQLDRDEHTLRSFSAGHAPLFHYVAATDTIKTLEADTMPFGITPQLPIEQPTPVAFGRADFFIVCSDGILEMKNPQGEQFGKERMLAFIQAHRAKAPSQWLDVLRAELTQFAAGVHPADDISVIVLKRT